MPMTSFLEVRFAAEHLIDGPAVLLEILADTRAFDGCTGIEVVTDIEDQGHVVVIEHWESLEHDNAYRAWRAGDGASDLATYLSGPASLTRFNDTTAL